MSSVVTSAQHVMRDDENYASGIAGVVATGKIVLQGLFEYSISVPREPALSSGVS